MKTKPRTSPRIGATRMKISVFVHPPGMITSNARPQPRRMAARAIAAPAYPPIRAWEEDVGRPHIQVRISHTMAPIRPAKTTYCVTMSSWIMPLPMVWATAVPNMKAAMKLKKAAHMTASLGERTRVETTVAMLFAASWNPFRKSKARATRTVMRTSISPVSTGRASSQFCQIRKDR